MIPDNTCQNCRDGYQTNCLHREFVGAGGCHAEKVRCLLAMAPLSRSPTCPPRSTSPASPLACTDVMGTGGYAAVAAQVEADDTVEEVND